MVKVQRINFETLFLLIMNYSQLKVTYTVTIDVNPGAQSAGNPLSDSFYVFDMQILQGQGLAGGCLIMQ